MKPKNNIKGLITAAGLGKRFGAITKRTNKGLLTVGHKPLLLDSLEKMKSEGIHDILVVCGYQSEILRKKVDPHAKTLLNPFYRVSGILGSFWMARSYLEGSPFLFTTSDHFFRQSVLTDCLRSREDVCIVVQKKDCYTKEDSKVIIQGGRIVDFGKNIPIDTASGEFAGMACFSQRGASLFFKVLENLLAKGRLQGYVTDVLKGMEREFKVPIAHSVCYDGARTEIDSVHDLLEARKIFKHI